MLRELSLAIVGADYTNKHGPTRRFELRLCLPGETVQLVHEPRNAADGNAIMILSARGVQIGYVAADRTSLIHRPWREGREVRAIFHCETVPGGWIRVAFDGAQPTLPPAPKILRIPDPAANLGADSESVFYPDEMPTEE